MTSEFLVAAALTDDAHTDLLNKKGSDDVLVPFFKKAFSKHQIYNSLPKDEFHRIAEQMRPEEVHQDVRTMLDQLAEALNPAS